LTFIKNGLSNSWCPQWGEYEKKKKI
jgi:hypothetical protein